MLGKSTVPFTLSGINEIASYYDTFFLDQFGVLHDGCSPYPGACSALARLHEAGKKLVIISNTGKRSKYTLEKLKILGFEPGWFAGVITSGETTHNALQNSNDPFFSSLGRKCLHLVWASQNETPESYGLIYVTDVTAADFVLVHGMEAVVNGLGSAQLLDLNSIKELIRVAARINLPLIIANPDIVTVDPQISLPLPGQAALWYAECGGAASSVKLMGKPSRIIYQAALDLLQGNGGRVLAVGDSFAHDICGAANFAVDSLYVARGIHALEIKGELTADSVQALANSLCCPFPTYAISTFRW